jgi:hypothetical protein
MKYVLMFCDTPELHDQIDPDDAKATYEEIYGWFEEQAKAGRIADGGAELQPVTTATTVKAGNGEGPVVVDGPFSEAKEVVGGWSIMQYDTLEEAVADQREFAELHAKYWPEVTVISTLRQISEAPGD